MEVSSQRIHDTQSKYEKQIIGYKHNTHQTIIGNLLGKNKLMAPAAVIAKHVLVRGN